MTAQNKLICKYTVVILIVVFVGSCLVSALFIHRTKETLTHTEARIETIDDLQKDLSEKVFEIEAAQDKYLSEMASDIFFIHAYYPRTKKCGQWVKHWRNRKNTSAFKLRIVSVDPSLIPLNSLIYIEGMGWHIAEKDKRNRSKGKVIKVCMTDPDKVKEFKKRPLKVFYNPNS